MYRVLARSTRFAGDGSVRARLFDLGDYPGIVLSTSPDDRVEGEVYELQPQSAVSVLNTLDDYEGIGPSDTWPREYERTVVQVQLRDGSAVPAWAYVLAEPNPRYPPIPATDYLEWLSRK
jgi:gamma-glutamylcyclotransferase (GGCT)/AIG2-like uncharacterized protein YtfP